MTALVNNTLFDDPTKQLTLDIDAAGELPAQVEEAEPLLDGATATYSPEDNKLRLYPLTRLDEETYRRVRQAGFIWAAKQGLFVAPMWTPQREDLLIELCGHIDDEDTSLVDRAAERADRFQGYKSNRERDARNATAAVDYITQGIPMGQPILVGHHSERHARRDAEKIERGMRRALKMWETAEYWTDRAAGALAHAKYKERPEVRHRRIKGLEADLRRVQAQYTPCPRTKPQVWDGVAHVWVGQGRGGYWQKEDSLPAIKERAQRWEFHYQNRLAYERAMLAEQGGIKADAYEFEVGGRVRVGNEWCVILRINKKDGQTVSLSTTRRYVSVVSVEDIEDYRPPAEGDAAKVKAATKLPPMANYPGEGFKHMTKAEWDRMYHDYKGSYVIEGDETHGKHRVRKVYGHGGGLVYLTDSKLTPAPAPAKEEPAQAIENEPAARSVPTTPTEATPSEADRLRDQLKTGVQVVAAPALFPTPPEIAARMVDMAEMEERPSGYEILEPSAGTGSILRAIRAAYPDPLQHRVHAIEIDERLYTGLLAGFPDVGLWQTDYLTTPTTGSGYDRILMNPPFTNAVDIDHILHAAQQLRPGGILVAICANGPRQNAVLRPLAEDSGGEWLPLGPDAFKSSGTGVNTVLLTYRRPL